MTPMLLVLVHFFPVLASLFVGRGCQYLGDWLIGDDQLHVRNSGFLWGTNHVE